MSAQNLLSFRFTKSLFNRGGHRVLFNAALTNVLQDTGEQSIVTRNFFAAGFGEPASWIQPRRLYFQITVR
jgi:hypothetical protein